MKSLKKLFILTLSTLAATMVMLCVTACTVVAPPTSNNGAEDNEIRKIYATYVAYAEERGETPLSYEEWLASIKGEKGDQGDKGDKGDQGEDGKSAYEIWLENGNTGTEEDFLNWLKTGETHSYGAWAIFTNADTCEERIFYRVCSDCNKLEFKHGSKEDHVFETAYSYNDFYHWLDCINCSATKDKFEHTEGEDGKCTVCEYTGTEGILYDIDASGEFAIVIGYNGTAKEIKIAGAYNGVPVTQINNIAFYDNDTITSVIIPNSVTTIGEWAFTDCTSLTSVVIGDRVTSIGYAAFGLCDSLTSVVIPDSVTSIGDWTFEHCYSLTSVVIGNSVTSIGDYAFVYCNSLTSVVIPDSVTTIGNSAFADCTSLTSVVIPDSVTSIGDDAFAYCDSLTSIEVDVNNMAYASIDGNLYNKDCSTLIQYAIGKEDSEFIVPNSVTSIGESAFYDCTSLKNVVIGDSVTSISDRAFYNCDSLTSVVIGNSVTTIGFYAFEHCSNLQFNKYDNCKYLGSVTNQYYALIGVTDIRYTTYTIHSDTAVVAVSAFSDCDSLTSIEVDSNNMAYASIDGNLYNKDCTTLIQYAIGKEDSEFIVPNSVTSIGESAFEYCTRLTSVVIPDSVTSIGEGAFSVCYSLTSVVIGNSVTSIGDYAFYSCYSLTSVVLGDSVTSIGYAAFYYCTSLTSVVIGDNVTTIGGGAFADCDSLTSVVIGDSVTTIGDSAFNNCDSLTSIKYRGTETEWSAISKGSKWDYKTGNYTITYNYQGE